MIDVVIVGAGGFGREVLQYVRDTYDPVSDVRVKGFLDDDPDAARHIDLGVPVLGTTGDYEPAPADRLLIAVGEPSLRRSLRERLHDRGARFFSLIHPLAYVAPTARVGVGCIISPFATVGTLADIGEHVALTFYASVGHDASVCSYTVLSPHSVTNGGSTLGEAAFLGAHAVVNPLRRVGDGAKVAAGSVVYHDVPAGVIALGNPAKHRPLLLRSVDARAVEAVPG
jgi:sugar O-acyltransferase (sialic acid O-acetyltransferase NeuD family)